MLKLVKWAYELGVKQERTRIARELEREQSRRTFESNLQRGMLRDDDLKLSKVRRQRLEFVNAVSVEIVDIVNKIFEPNHSLPSPTSIMWPEEIK